MKLTAKFYSCNIEMDVEDVILIQEGMTDKDIKKIIQPKYNNQLDFILEKNIRAALIEWEIPSRIFTDLRVEILKLSAKIIDHKFLRDCY